MQPVNVIALILILGLELLIISMEKHNSAMKIIGCIVMLVGWICNMIALAIN